jgi:hypothetical protein
LFGGADDGVGERVVDLIAAADRSSNTPTATIRSPSTRTADTLASS